RASSKSQLVWRAGGRKSWDCMDQRTMRRARLAYNLRLTGPRAEPPVPTPRRIGANERLGPGLLAHSTFSVAAHSDMTAPAAEACRGGGPLAVERTCLAIVLAAGEGTRMRSTRPKVLHAIAGQSLLAHVLDAVRKAGGTMTAVVVGLGA